MRAVYQQLNRLSGALVMSALITGCAPHAVRVDCDKHLEPINRPAPAGKRAAATSALSPQSPQPPEKGTDDSTTRKDPEP
jgi:hypothetical protein